MLYSLITLLTALLLAPLLSGIINRIKAFYGGRRGVPLLQGYYDLIKLCRKGAVYSDCSSWLFKAGPVIGLAAMITALLLVPFNGINAVVSFQGDFLLLLYLLAASRFFTVLAALDTGSAFEGMGASRELQFALLAELATFLGFMTLAVYTKEYSLSSMLSNIFATGTPKESISIAVLSGVSLFIVLLTENCRIPFDDPNTHLELTMIHEVMVLDHSGIDFAYIQYGSYLKLWISSSIVISLVQPFHFQTPVFNYLLGILAVSILAVAVGVVESSIARIKMNKVSHLLVASCVFSFLALIICAR